MTRAGRRWDPFSAEVLPVNEPKHTPFNERIVKQSREKYSKPREVVERQLEGGAQEESKPAPQISADEIIV